MDRKELLVKGAGGVEGAVVAIVLTVQMMMTKDFLVALEKN